MSEYDYDSYCGIYCGACDIMHVGRTGRKSRFASFLSESNIRAFQRALGNQYDPGKPVELKCHGCKTDELFFNCRACGIRPCARAKGVANCIECPDYPCGLITQMNSGASLLPHIRANGDNLETIQREGVHRWLLKQEAQWRCPECGNGIAWYTERCGTCGADCRSKTHRFTLLSSLILSIVFRLSALGRRGRAANDDRN
ncbi:MAG: DUF3795 domain-containing protein [Spirochaetes bacterium]|nr:DUF3795 domain-containing protein [Spirochaetota bacterium]